MNNLPSPFVMTTQTDLDPRGTRMPPFDHLTDRVDYVRGMAQELEDHAHFTWVSARLIFGLCTIARNWLTPVFAYCRVSAEVDAWLEDRTVNISIDFEDEANRARFTQLEPELAALLQTAPGRCFCQGVPGVIHGHGS